MKVPVLTGGQAKLLLRKRLLSALALTAVVVLVATEAGCGVSSPSGLTAGWPQGFKTASRWSSVGATPPPYNLWSLLCDRGVLYAGAGVGDGNVLAWNGLQWADVGDLAALDRGSGIAALVTLKGRLYAAAGDGVWSWNCFVWSPLGGAPRSINCMAASQDTLFAGTVQGVWSWDGSAWSQVGGSRGLSGDAANVTKLLTANGAVYAGTMYDGVWRWDGSGWSQVGGATGLSGAPANIHDLAAANGLLYAATDGGVWSWNGSAWYHVGIEFTVSSILPVNGKLYAGSWNDGELPGGVWEWDGSSWSPVGKGLGGLATCVDRFLAAGGTLYAGTMDGVWTWDGSSWQRLGGYNELGVNSLATADGALYVWTFSDGIWEWNGWTWSQLGRFKDLAGEAAQGHSILPLDGRLFAGTDAGGVWTWDGSTWARVGSPASLRHRVITSLAMAGGTLVAGGYGGVWECDGPGWSRLGLAGPAGNAANVSSLLVFNHRLYAGTRDGVWSLPLDGQQ